MTDNDKLLAWQDNGSTPGKTLPDYLNDDAAAMSLLDTLVEKGYEALLQSDAKLWWVDIYNYEVEAVSPVAVSGWKSVRREAVCAAVLEMIEKEDV